MRSTTFLVVAAIFLWACEGDLGRKRRDHDDGGGGSGASAGGPGSGGDGGTGAFGGSGGSGPGPGGGGSGTGAGDSVCARWNADRAGLAEGNWTGSVSGCNAGDVLAPGRENALKLVNLYRFLGNLPQVVNDGGSMDSNAQACALMMTANGQLSHTPPMSWTCYTSAGATGAGTSNIASTAGVTAVDLYMADPGNPQTMGHRRWLMSNSLGPIGLGSTSSYSCLTVIGGSGNAGAPFMAFPTPGYFPYEALHASFQSVDETGWTIQSDAIDLSSAQVTVTDGANTLPVQVVQLLGGYGSAQAINFLPQGWQGQAGHTYHVSVSGASQPIEYDVMIVGCQ
jgi:cysteine-rich secretory family protein